MRWNVSGLLPVAMLGCAVPARDNPDDPKNAPIAELVVAAASESTSACLEELPTEKETGEAFARRRCLYLDASSSHSPRGLPLSFTFFDELGAQLPKLEDEDDFAVLDSSYRFQTLPVGVPIRFSVEATDTEGGRATAFADLLLTNTAPVGVVAAPRTLPVGGLPWDPGTPFAANFDASESYDTDGDSLEYCWTFTGPNEASPGEICRPDPADPEFTRVVQSNYGLTVGRLRVSDGAADSDTRLQPVFVREPNLWAAPPSPGPLERLDPIRQQVRDNAISWAAPLVAPGSTPRVAVITQDPARRIEIYDARDGSLLGATAVSTTSGALWIASDPATPRLWTMTVADDRSEARLDSWTVGAGGALVHETGPVAAAFTHESDNDLPMLAAVDGDGSVWFSPGMSGPIVRVTTEGVGSTVDTPGLSYTGISRRPGTGEVWTMEAPDLFAGSAGAARIRRFVDASDPGTPFPTGGFFASQLEWISENEFWTIDSERGVVLVDATLLEAGADFDASVVAAFPSALDIFFLSVDPLTGDAEGIDSSFQVLVTFHRNGLHESRPGRALPLFRDSLGQAWVLDIELDGFFRGLSADPTGRAGTRIDIPARGFTSYDWNSGGTWSMTRYPPVDAIYRFAENGSVLRQVTSVRVAGENSDRSLSGFGKLRVSPDGAWGALFYSGSEITTGLYAIDFSLTIPAVSLLLAGPSDPSAWEIGSPANGANPFLWIVESNGDVRTLSRTGVLSAAIVNLPERDGGTNLAAVIARDLSDNRLCIATEDAGASIFQVRRVSTGGVVETLGSFPRPAATNAMFAVAASRDASTHVCWLAVSDEDPAPHALSIQGWSSAGAVHHTMFTRSGSTLRGIYTPDNDTLLLDVADPATFREHLHRVAWDPVGGAWGPATDFRDASTLARPVSAEASLMTLAN